MVLLLAFPPHRRETETMKKRWIVLLCMLGCCIAYGQQTVVTVPDEPANLDGIKQQLKRYQSCSEPNCYVPQLEHQADLAIVFMNQSVAAAKAEEKLAIVLDIDETSLSNWSVELHDDFGYIPTDSNGVLHSGAGRRLPAHSVFSAKRRKTK